jgi:hypothetical protein
MTTSEEVACDVYGSCGHMSCAVVSRISYKAAEDSNRERELSTRRSVAFKGYRPAPPAEYAEKGITNSGDEPDYEGYIFSDGTVAVRWLTQFRSVSIWASWDDFWRVHGHPEYETRIVFTKPEEPRFMEDTRVDVYRTGDTKRVKITHLPTGFTAVSNTREGAVDTLGNWLSEKHPCYFKPGSPITSVPVDDTTPRTELRHWEYRVC